MNQPMNMAPKNPVPPIKVTAKVVSFTVVDNQFASAPVRLETSGSKRLLKIDFEIPYGGMPLMIDRISLDEQDLSAGAIDPQIEALKLFESHHKAIVKVLREECDVFHNH